MTKDGIINLLNKNIKQIENERNLDLNNTSYWAGVKEGLLRAKSFIGMLDKDNNR